MTQRDTSTDASIGTVGATRQAIRGVAMALLAAVLWGTTGTAQSLAPVGMPSVWIGALRLLVAALFFVALYQGSMLATGSLSGKQSTDPAPHGLWRVVVAAGLSVAAYNLCFFAGVRASGVAVGTAVAIGSGPIWAGLIQRLVLGQGLLPSWWLGTVLAVAGGAVMVLAGTGPGGQGAASGADPRVSVGGLVLCLGAGLSYAIYTFFNKQLVRHWVPARTNAWVFGTAAALSCAVAPALADWETPSSTGWLVLLWLGLAATGLAYLLFTTALRHLSGATGVALALGEPVTAFVLAVVLVGERPGWAALAGLGAVLGGLAVVIRTELQGAARTGRR